MSIITNYKTLWLTAACALLSIFSKAQNYEFGIFAGTSNYQGDLADGAIVWKKAQPAGGLLVRYSPLDFLSFRMGFTAGKLVGDDQTSSKPNIRERGFTFTSNIREVSLLTEIHLPTFGSSSYGIFKARFSPFLFAGIGISTINGEPEAPKDVIPYPFPEFDARKKFMCVPFGGGVKFRFAEAFSTSIEWGTRTVFNDYLDGISVNGNPKRNDWYMFGGITLTYVIDGGDDNPYRGRR